MPKVTTKSRIARLLKMGLDSRQIAEVTGIKLTTVRSNVWQIKNPEKVKNKSREYYQNNKAARLAYAKQYYQRNREYIDEQRQEYRIEYWHRRGKELRRQRRQCEI